jgi:hypothetical protein
LRPASGALLLPPKVATLKSYFDRQDQNFFIATARNELSSIVAGGVGTNRLDWQQQNPALFQQSLPTSLIRPPHE